MSSIEGMATPAADVGASPTVKGPAAAVPVPTAWSAPTAATAPTAARAPAPAGDVGRSAARGGGSAAAGAGAFRPPEAPPSSASKRFTNRRRSKLSSSAACKRAWKHLFSFSSSWARTRASLSCPSRARCFWSKRRSRSVAAAELSASSTTSTLRSCCLNAATSSNEGRSESCSLRLWISASLAAARLASSFCWSRPSTSRRSARPLASASCRRNSAHSRSKSAARFCTPSRRDCNTFTEPWASRCSTG
mmetsp:Transcript_63249/g.135916  ORF Transcript_63249/g.135916 Transcript_63249/m.135916 type:complete len:249 (-) Transcript_63249:908-1654(-)